MQIPTAFVVGADGVRSRVARAVGAGMVDERPSDAATHYTYVAGLRRVIEPNRSLRGPGRVLVSSGAGYVLHLVPGQPDAVAFEQDLGRARQLRKAGDAAGAVSALDSALSLWRGSAFAGVPGPFAETERVRLGELRSAAAEERADVLLALGRHEEVVPDLTAMVADHPLRERMRGLLMVALYRCGRQAEALRVFAEGRRVLAEELGIDPGGDLSRIHQQVLTSDPALSVPNGLAIRAAGGSAPSDEDAGSEPAPDGGQRRPRPEGRTTPVPAQLPLDAPGFSGRREELSILRAMLPAEPGQQSPGQQDSGPTVPIVVLSSRGDEVGKVQALDLGADDYITKPFGMDELLARMRAALRHQLQVHGERPIFRTGDLSVDLVRRIVKVGDKEVKLSPKEYDLLRVLVQHAGKVLTHKFLLGELWDALTDAQYLRVYVRQLRQKIEADPERPQYVLTETGIGYRLRAPEQELQ